MGKNFWLKEEIPKWEKSMEELDFGCTDKFSGKIFLTSAGGFHIEMRDDKTDNEGMYK